MRKIVNVNNKKLKKEFENPYYVNLYIGPTVHVAWIMNLLVIIH